MAEVVRYVDPAATGLQTGEDWANAYVSLLSWSQNEATDLPTDADNHVCNTRSSGAHPADTSAVTMSGWTMDADHDVVIQAASGHEALLTGWDTDRYRLSVTGENNEALLIADSTSYVTIIGLQIEQNSTDDGVVFTSSAGAGLLHGCRIRTCNYGVYHSQSSGSFDLTVQISIIEDCAVDGIYYRTLTGTGLAYFLIVHNCTDDGIQAATANTMSAIDCVVFDNGDDFIGTFTAITNCASDDGDYTGGVDNSIAPSGASWANEYPDYATDDWTISTGGNCYHGGVPISGLTLDMNGDTYHATTPSVGVDEDVSGGGSSIVVLRRRRAA